MSKLVNLQEERIKKSPHMAGDATCLNCKHEWACVAPVGTYIFECPNCGLYKGVFSSLCHAGLGDSFLSCTCGYGVFYITPKDILCCYCGNSVEIPNG